MLDKRPFPKLFVTDLDGTALGGGHQPYSRLPDVFSGFLDRLDARGCRWAVNSTWDVPGQWQIVQISAVASQPRYLIGEMGYQLASIDGGKLVMDRPYNDKMEDIVDEIVQAKLLPLVKDITAKFTPLNSHFYGRFFQFDVYADELETLEDYVAERYFEEDDLVCFCENGRMVAYPSALDKSRGLAEAIRLGGYLPAEVAVAGDELPDLRMMSSQLAAYALCPDNANPAIKERTLKMKGSIGSRPFADGVVEAFGQLAVRHGWDW